MSYKSNKILSSSYPSHLSLDLPVKFQIFHFSKKKKHIWGLDPSLIYIRKTNNSSHGSTTFVEYFFDCALWWWYLVLVRGQKITYAPTILLGRYFLSILHSLYSNKQTILFPYCFEFQFLIGPITYVTVQSDNLFR